MPSQSSPVILCAMTILAATIGSEAAKADNEVKITYMSSRGTIVEYDNAGEHCLVAKPNAWYAEPIVTTWTAQVQAASGYEPKNTSVRTINIQGGDGDDITVYISTNTSSFQLSNFGLKDCEGISLNTDADLTLYATFYGDLKGNIRTNDPSDRPIKYVDFQCAGTIESGVSITAVDVNSVRAHIIEGGVTVESTGGTSAKIGTVRTGYSNGERTNVPVPSGGWPTMSQMDIGTSEDPVVIRTPTDVNISQRILSLDDLYVELDVGGHTAQLRNARGALEQTYNYNIGTLTHHMQVTGHTNKISSIWASADNGGYLDTGSSIFYIDSPTTDYNAKIGSVADATGANEVDFRGKFWFAGGIAATADIRLSDSMNGEMIFNAANNQRLWSAQSNVQINGTNVSADENNPAYALLTSGGGTVGMVDGVGNDLGFHLHLEACVPVSGSNISEAAWESGDHPINLVFYGPIYENGNEPYVQLQWYDSQSNQWVDILCAVLPAHPLEYDLGPSGSNTSYNVLEINKCPDCPCSFPLGEYRIMQEDSALKSNLGLANDPDVQPFEYHFTLVQ